MPDRHIYQIISVGILLILMLVSCSTRMASDQSLPRMDGKYDSEYPSVHPSQSLHSITRTVYKMHSMAFYRSFTISRQNRVETADIERDRVESIAVGDTIFNQSVIGSATVLHADTRQIALLTCAHVVDFPDTLVRYYPRESRDEETRYIQVIAYKIRQQNFITALPGTGDLQILASDESRDLALVGTTFQSSPEPPITPLDFPLGSAAELDWGNFVYLVGFPLGKKMITQGLVSPLAGRNPSFLIDAPFNQGMSGAPVLAIRDGVPNFELVGIANAVASKSQYVLTPDQDDDETEASYIPDMPYSGEIFTSRTEKILYGVTYVIPAEEIVQFLISNQRSLLIHGYDLTHLFPEQ